MSPSLQTLSLRGSPPPAPTLIGQHSTESATSTEKAVRAHTSQIQHCTKKQNNKLSDYSFWAPYSAATTTRICDHDQFYKHWPIKEISAYLKNYPL